MDSFIIDFYSPDMKDSLTIAWPSNKIPSHGTIYYDSSKIMSPGSNSFEFT